MKRVQQKVHSAFSPRRQRMFLIAAGIALQFAIYVVLLVLFSQYFVYFYWICVLVSLVMALFISTWKSKLAYKIAWIIPILLFPAFGWLVYLLCGGNKLSARKRRKMQGMDRTMLEQLEREPGRQIIVADCGCYAALRLTRALDGEMLVIRFSWLQSAGADSLRGYEEWVRLPYRRFHECVEAGTDMAGWNWSQLSVPEKVTRRFEFHSRQNLHQIAQRPLLRHKLGKTLEHHFQWRDAEKILIYDDGAPYSFFFEEVTPRGTGICGGIILHGADNLQKAQYSVHT